MQVSAAPLERSESEISCMNSQSFLGDGAPVKTLDTEPGVSSRVCKCSLLAHLCWEHRAAHDTLGRRTKVPCFTFPLTYIHFPGQFFLSVSFKKLQSPGYIPRENHTLLDSHLSVPCFIRDSLVDQMVKNLPAVWETWVRSLGGEDPLEEGTATHSNLLAYYCPRGKPPWTEVPGRLQSMGSQRVGHD